MKKLLKKDFLAEVMTEIEHIKAHATTQEVERLNISFFDHNSPEHCIYGQMTGHCKSERAKVLCPKVYSGIGGVSNSKWRKFSEQNFDKLYGEYTPLEKYLYMTKWLMHRGIIRYLKGETQKLKLV